MFHDLLLVRMCHSDPRVEEAQLHAVRKTLHCNGGDLTDENITEIFDKFGNRTPRCNWQSTKGWTVDCEWKAPPSFIGKKQPPAQEYPEDADEFEV